MGFCWWGVYEHSGVAVQLGTSQTSIPIRIAISRTPHILKVQRDISTTDQYRQISNTTQHVHLFRHVAALVSCRDTNILSTHIALLISIINIVHINTFTTVIPLLINISHNIHPHFVVHNNLILLSTPIPTLLTHIHNHITDILVLNNAILIVLATASSLNNTAPIGPARSTQGGGVLGKRGWAVFFDGVQS
jgi:hypothetical protein